MGTCTEAQSLGGWLVDSCTGLVGSVLAVALLHAAVAYYYDQEYPAQHCAVDWADGISNTEQVIVVSTNRQ